MRKFLAFAVAFMLLAAPAGADSGDQATLQAVQAYLNGIVTLKARFTQTAFDGTHAAGDFLLKRPGRMRFEYDKPVTDFIVADGSLVYYYDGQLKQQSSAPISKSLADFFLRQNLSFSGDLRVADIRRDKGDILVKLVQAKDPLSGSLTLVLGEKPLVLKSWRVIDAEGRVTTVALSDIATGVDLSNSLFRYVDPAHSKSNYN